MSAYNVSTYIIELLEIDAYVYRSEIEELHCRSILGSHYEQ